MNDFFMCFAQTDATHGAKSCGEYEGNVSALANVIFMQRLQLVFSHVES